MAEPDSSNIIDLTSSPSPSDVIEVANPKDSEPTPCKSSKDEKKSLKRKRKKRSSVGNDSKASSARPSRAQSIEPGEVDDDPSRGEGGSSSRTELLEDDSRRTKRRTDSKRSKSRNDNPSERRRSRSPRRRGPSPRPENTADIFFVDITPAALPIIPSQTAIPTDSENTPKLLLPTHVTVFGDDPDEILPPPEVESGQEDFIEILDEDRPGYTRYYEADKLAKIVCKTCGAEGDHKTQKCRALICSTCGVRDEHPTPMCPMSKICFRCGVRGHVNANCPNRLESSGYRNECERCGSFKHATIGCPTWWRLYTYLGKEERASTLDLRREKEQMHMGQGGEGFIADDEWCYNCGSCGHWGDDCDQMPHPHDFPSDPSAFSAYNLTSGPFFDPNSESKPSSSRKVYRDWESEAPVNSNLPQNVGRRAREKEMAKLRKNYDRAGDDEDDWFGRSRAAGGGGGGRQPPTQPRGHQNDPRTESRRITFGSSLKDPGRWQQQSGLPPKPPPPSLLNRLTDGPGHDGGRRSNEAPTGPRSSRAERRREREREKDRESERRDRREKEKDKRYDRNKDKNKYHDRRDSGPRYKGGYSR